MNYDEYTQKNHVLSHICADAGKDMFCSRCGAEWYDADPLSIRCGAEWYDADPLSIRCGVEWHDLAAEIEKARNKK